MELVNGGPVTLRSTAVRQRGDVKAGGSELRVQRELRVRARVSHGWIKRIGKKINKKKNIYIYIYIKTEVSEIPTSFHIIVLIYKKI